MKLKPKTHRTLTCKCKMTKMPAAAESDTCAWGFEKWCGRRRLLRLIGWQRLLRFIGRRRLQRLIGRWRVLKPVFGFRRKPSHRFAQKRSEAAVLRHGHTDGEAWHDWGSKKTQLWHRCFFSSFGDSQWTGFSVYDSTLQRMVALGYTIY